MSALHYAIGFALHCGEATSQPLRGCPILEQCITDKLVL